jgi:hypothetical protein
MQLRKRNVLGCDYWFPGSPSGRLALCPKCCAETSAANSLLFFADFA